MKMTEREFQELMQRRGVKLERKPNKYHAIPTEADTFRFDSKSEATFYRIAKRRVEMGELSFFLRQVPFHLPGGVKLVIDFMLFAIGGEVEVVDVKGYKPTEAWTAKRKIMEALYPVKVKIVTRKEIGQLVRSYGLSA